MISPNFSRPGLVYYVFCGSRAEVVLQQFLLPCRAFVRTRCLISLNFSYPGLVYYLQQSCPSDYIKHVHHAFIIIFETRNTGCCYGHAPRLAHSPPHGTSFGWFVFLSSHLIPDHGISGLYPSSGRGHQISPSLSIEAWARLV